MGYSNFYGDETKAFYLDKTTPATKFLLNQRKGPVQFLVGWTVEKLTGGYNELLTRTPFAFAGTLSILVLFLIVQKIAGNKAALIAAGLYGFNGFFIAFSRTVQYQSFMLLFGFLAIYFALLYESAKNNTRKHYAILSALFLAFSYLSHYDAIFFDVAIAFILVKKILDNKEDLIGVIKEIGTYYILPFVITAGLFYIPYFLYGYYFSNTFNYVNRRLTGFEYAKNISWYTFWIYNPHLIWAFLTVFIVPFLLKRAEWDRHLLFFWFLVPFIVFEFIVTNPGTHIHNYFIPLIIMISIGITDFLGFLEKKFVRQVFYAFLVYVFAVLFMVGVFVYIPSANNGYPWIDSTIGFTDIPKANKDLHLFLYGFPYDRGWLQIADYVEKRGGVRRVYTNDNDTIAKYYLRGIRYIIPGPNYLPDFFVFVYNNQEFVDIPLEMRIELDDKSLTHHYQPEKEFYVDGELVAVFYKCVHLCSR